MEWEDERAAWRTAVQTQRLGVVLCYCPACDRQHAVSKGDWTAAKIGTMCVRDEGGFNEPIRWAVTCPQHTLYDVWLRVKGPTEEWRQRHARHLHRPTRT
jgi:hypothetical protein